MTPLAALTHLDKARARAARSLTLERAALAFRVIILAASVLALASLLGAWRLLHPLAHATAGLAAIALSVWALWLTARNYRTPTSAEIDRRVAESSSEQGLIDGLDDRPAGGDLIAHAVWREHQKRLAERAGAIDSKPKGKLWRAIDPWGARWVLVTLFLAAGLNAGREAPSRFMEAFSPPWGAFLGDGRLTFDVWATPPAYTGQNAIYLAGRAATPGAAASAPEGSVLSVRIFGAKGAPVLVMRSKDGVKRVPFSEAGGGAFEAKGALMADSRIEVRRFGLRAHWTVRVIDDKSPSAVFVAAPRVGSDERVSFTWRAKDDFGVRQVWLKLRLLNPDIGPDTSNRDEISIPLPAANARLVEASERLDMLAHQFAGLKVEVRLVAADALGQRGESGPATLILPEKKFENPLAMAIVEARRVLLRERRQYDAKSVSVFENNLERTKRAPEGVKRSARLIEAITSEPAQFFSDASVYLGLKYALGQISNARNIQEAHVAGATLWAIALKVEYGDRAEAELKLEAAKDALKKAIRDGADAKELDRLTSALKDAIREAIEARAAEAMTKPKDPRIQAQQPPPKDVQQKDIDKMLNEIKDAAKGGRKDEAQRSLDQLGQMMDEMGAQPGKTGEQTKEGQNGEQKEGQQGQINKAMQQLGKVMDEQRQLADQTFQKAQEGSGGGDDKMSKAQGDIAGELAQAAGSAGKQPGSDALDAAGKAMRDAQQAMAKGDFGKAMGLQAEAMSKMREGAAALAQAAKMANARDNPGQGESKDPLGRQPGMGVGGGRNVKIPDAGERQRAQEILDEIKKRAARADSDPVERSYLERLLERF